MYIVLLTSLLAMLKSIVYSSVVVMISWDMVYLDIRIIDNR